MAVTNPYHEFLRMVYRMRRAQKDFFKTKSRERQAEAMKLEREVDEWLESTSLQSAKVKQMGFDLEGQKGE
jgi:hypothetical protein